MEIKDSLTKPEKINFDSYSKPQQIGVYNTRKLYDQEIRIFNKYLKNGKRLKILDIGCGTGRTTINLAELGHDVIGIDIVPDMIEQAKNKYPNIDFKVMNACDLQFPDNYFDVVLFSFNGLDCIYPLEKRWRSVRETRRVLKKDGLYIMSSHNSIVGFNNKYKIFWWILNILSGRIFTPYKLEYKGYRIGVRFIYFSRLPSRHIKNINDLGFELLEIFTKKQNNNTLLKINLFEEWPYYIFKKINEYNDSK